MKYVNQKETWTLFDRNNEEIAKTVSLGFDNDPSAGDMLFNENFADQLVRDSDPEDVESECRQTFSATLSALLHQENFLYCFPETEERKEIVIATVEYKRECDMIEEKEFESNCAEFDARAPHDQLKRCDDNDDDREEWDGDIGAEGSCPRCQTGRLCRDAEQIGFISRTSYECSECDLNVGESSDASSVYVLTTYSGQDDRLVVYRSKPLGDFPEQGYEPTDDMDLDEWWEQHKEKANV
jgi:hypothetical protein